MGNKRHKKDEGWSNLGLMLIFVFVNSRNITIQTLNTIELLIHSNIYVFTEKHLYLHLLATNEIFLTVAI